MPVGPGAAGLLAVADGGDADLLLFQKAGEQIANVAIVVDDQDVRDRFHAS